VNEERAEQVVSAYLRERGGSGWPDLMDSVARSLLPDTDTWVAFLPTPEEEPMVLVVASGALYRVRPFETSEGPGLFVDRFELSGGRARVSVAETEVRGHGATWRRRDWQFALEGDNNPLLLSTEQVLAEGAPVDRLERVARAVATQTGWSVEP